jgi:hypothetical protein
MEHHMSNEGWQLALALKAGGYDLCGHGLSTTRTLEILKQKNPSVVFVQDQHEWESGHLAKREEYFYDTPELARRPDVFKLTVVKDTHRQYESAKQYSRSIGCHAWVAYYNLPIVFRTLNWLRPQHVVRTYHTIDANSVPPYQAEGRRTCLLSGALGGAYPLRCRIHEARMPEVYFMQHPGYFNTGTCTPAYLREMSRYRVSICTASKFGYTLRKLIESTACGCRVITDLPADEPLPEIDDNLIRVSPNMDMGEMRKLICHLSDSYDPVVQEKMAEAAKARYDYRVEGARLASEIESLRRTYGQV